MASYSEGDKVEWDWGNGTGTGKIQSKFEEKTTRKIKGTEVTRDGSSDDPALYIKQDDGDAVLKLASEVRKV
ncbi:DUF2945 domain-containing protein [Sulfitobacter aestuariivivens]|uniref:DUF2945 domain-containing protein n=1 Tax=Sulfitobacter aestuariivivens TaxID=2766981 RepID=A0A927D6R4_9RHOB|nr:DUF2945 domain-containing protein [Sulfitobacter aestuariivivens]MBD3664547.1 DUF2945 domain-containing protein [Sulfitobacter aestuariivivens]